MGFDLATCKLLAIGNQAGMNDFTCVDSVGKEEAEKALSRLFSASRQTINESRDVVLCGIPFCEFGPAPYYRDCYDDVVKAVANFPVDISQARIEPANLLKLGCLKMPKVDIATAQMMIGTSAFLLATLKKRSICVGGTHAISFPIINAIKILDDFGLVWLDAHTDMYHNRELLDSDTARFSNANVLSRILRARPNLASKTVLIGTRVAGDEYRRFLPRDQVYTVWDVQRKGSARIVDEVVKLIPSRKLYLSVDLDVLDPAFAPGVSTPVPGGLTTFEVLEFVHLLSRRGSVIGGDLVEIDRSRDIAGLTLLAASRILVELAVGMQ